MTSVSATALQPAVDVAQASRHLELLHSDAPGFAGLVLLGAQRHERHCFFTREDLVPASNVDDSREGLQDVVDARWNVYTALATFARVPARGRGTRADVLSVPGVWADLDVKPDVEGYFASEDAALRYVRDLPRPTLEVASGSGGRHLYWLTHERLDAVAGQELLLMWLDFLRAEANGRTIENVHDTTRILRLAGTVRWPKAGDATPLPQRVVITREGPHYPLEELRTLAQPAHSEARALRDEVRQRRHDADARRRYELTTRGLRTENYERVVRVFNAQQDWAQLLEGTGWTLHSDQRDTVARCRYWTRPGKSVTDGKSASTDFTASNGVTSHLMTIYSNDPALHDVREKVDELDAVGVCTKWTYALKRVFNGDEVALLRAAVAGKGRLP